MFAEPARQPRTPQRRPEVRLASPVDRAKANLKDAEAVVLQSETWLQEVIKRVGQPDFDIDDIQYLRGLLGSEKFEEGSVKFLDQAAKAAAQALDRADLTPDQKTQLLLNLSAAEAHLRGLGMRLAGLKLMLSGPKPIQPAPPRA